MQVLMVEPTYFEVTYSINPFMQDSAGNLKKVDKKLAVQQWSHLKSLFEKLGLKVLVMPGVQGLPDMVFTANHGLITQDKMLMGNYHSPYRQKETQYFQKFYEEIQLPYQSNDYLRGESFEGTGDALWSFDRKTLFAGHGFRTTLQAYEKVQKELPGKELVILKLIHKHFYHMDTCLTILNADFASYVPEAFDDESKDKLATHFQNLIPISLDEAIDFMAGNAFCPDGKNVILQKGALKYEDQLRKNGFNIHAVETSEFIKSGGSVFCLKQVIS